MSTEYLHPIQNPASSQRVGVASGESQKLTNQQTDAIQHQAIYRAPSTIFGVLSRLARIHSAIALTIPAFCGAFLAAWQYNQFSPLVFAFTVTSILCSVIGVNILSEYNDFRYSRLPEAKYVDEAFVAGSNLIKAGLIVPQLVIGSGTILLSIGIVCLFWLVLLIGWAMLFFGGLSFLILCIYGLPPSRNLYLSRGLGELSTLISFGLLQVVGSFYAQALALTPSPFWASIPLGLLSVLVCTSYNLIHWRRDWILRRRTLVVILGENRWLNLATVMVLLAYISLLLLVIFAIFPLWALLSLAAMPVALDGFKQIRRNHLRADHHYYLHTSFIRGMILTGLLLCAALWLDKML